MPEEPKEEQGFTISDRRTSSLSTEEKEKRDRVEAEKPAPKMGPQSVLQQPSKGMGGRPEEPPLDFSSLLLSLGSSALIQMGEVADPVTHKAAKNLPAAKQTVDLIALLKEKTKGNLTTEEGRLIDDLLYDLRLRFVRQTKQI